MRCCSAGSKELRITHNYVWWFTRMVLSSLRNNSMMSSTTESTGLKTKNCSTYFLHRYVKYFAFAALEATTIESL